MTPSFFRYSTAFEEVARPLSWLRASGEVDFKELCENDGVDDTLPRLKNTILSGTPAIGPSELDMMWLQLKQQLSGYRFESYRPRHEGPIWFCMVAANAGFQAAFGTHKLEALDAVKDCSQLDK